MSRITMRQLVARLLVAGSLAVLPVGLVTVPAAADPITPVAHRGHHDCDRSGPWQWQQNRGQWQWGNCDTRSGHWVWVWDDHRHHGDWQWYHHWSPSAPPPPPRAPYGVPFFGSS